MVIDCHFHLDYDSITIDKLLQSMDVTGVNKTALMASLSAPFPDPPSFLISLFRFILTHRTFRNIGRLFSSNFTPEGDLKLPRGSVHIYPDPDNEPVFSMVKKHQDRFLGWIFVNPKGKNDQIAELDRWKNNKGFIGVKAHPFWHQYAPVELAPVAKRLESLKKPLLLHVGYGEHGDYDALLKEAPGLKLILAHAGFPLYEDTWKAIRNNKNIFLDLSQTIYVSEKIIQQVVEYLGAERCIFGTDGPHGLRGKDGNFDYGIIKRIIEKKFPDKGVQRRLLGENFAELTGIS